MGTGLMALLGAGVPVGDGVSGFFRFSKKATNPVPNGLNPVPNWHPIGTTRDILRYIESMLRLARFQYFESFL